MKMNFEFPGNHNELFSEMEKIFEGVMNKDPESEMYNPVVSISEDEKNIYLELEIPGVLKDGVSIKFENNELRVSGERKTGKNEEERQYYNNKRRPQKFLKSFTLPSNIDASLIEAKLENGILEIIIPKYEQNKPGERKIDIK